MGKQRPHGSGTAGESGALDCARPVRCAADTGAECAVCVTLLVGAGAHHMNHITGTTSSAHSSQHTGANETSFSEIELVSRCRLPVCAPGGATAYVHLVVACW